MSTSDQFPQPKVENGMTLDKLQSLLQLHPEVPTDTWGTSEAKTINDLLVEIQKGEAKLIEKRREGGKVELIRLTHGLAINVYCSTDGKIMRLKEEKQVLAAEGKVLPECRVRQRGAETMDTSMGEKLTEAESRTDALQRALREELGNDELGNPIVTEDVTTYIDEGVVMKERDSASFPGLKSRHQLQRYDVLLPEKFYKSGGILKSS